MLCLDAFVVLAEVRKGIGYSETEVTDSHELPCWWWEPNLLSTTDMILTTESPHQHLGTERDLVTSERGRGTEQDIHVLLWPSQAIHTYYTHVYHTTHHI